MKDKMTYTGVGFIFSFINLGLIQTRFNFLGIIFGLVACFFFIKALKCKEN